VWYLPFLPFLISWIELLETTDFDCDVQLIWDKADSISLIKPLQRLPEHDSRMLLNLTILWDWKNQYLK